MDFFKDFFKRLFTNGFDKYFSKNKYATSYFCLPVFSMNVVREKNLSKGTTPVVAVITLGMFDGVHRGHLALLHQLRTLSHQWQCKSVVVSFDEHPAKALRGLETDFMLTTDEEKFLRLERSGCVDMLYLLESKPDLFGMDAQQFLNEKIFTHFQVKHFLIGHDSKFGKNRQGSVHLLQEYERLKGFDVSEAVMVLTDENEKISSTRIRKLLKEQRISTANEMLGYSYTISGIVVKGDQRGRTIGFPTANIHIADVRKLIPQNGVYAVSVRISHQRYEAKHFLGMMNIGIRPTFSVGNRLVVEVHILEFQDDIYDTQLTVEVLSFIRSEQKFETVQKLVFQLTEDKKAVQSFLKIKGLFNLK